MASAQTALRAAIAADAGIIAILGADPLPRIFSPVLPTGTDLSVTPALTIQDVDLTPLAETTDGPWLRFVHRFQVSALAETVVSVHSLRDATITALDNLSGTFDTIELKAIRFLPGSGIGAYNPETQTSRSTMDFDVQL